ncbi:MAG: hypothetical protein V1686_00670 [Patescibacteria group bacterium]
MAKSKEKNKAIDLRIGGASIKEIAKQLQVSKGTVSLWCRDIKLTLNQLKNLYERQRQGAYKGSRVQYERRLKKIEECKNQGIKEIGILSDRELMLVGLSLYWGEGAKSESSKKVKISNSDPRLIKLTIKWFKSIWKISNDRFTFRVGINEIHKDRIKKVEKYWARITGFSLRYFYKSTLIKVKNKKHYKNFPTYYGTLIIEIKKPAELHYKILGLIEGLSKS